jgi:outer membrane protein OmpA-like peptidoglycan-associated protein
VSDDEDRCPDTPGVVENQGCPDVDSDGDGFVDRVDQCPFEPETFNDVDDDDGCPDEPAALAALVGDKIVIYEPVLFERDQSTVDKRSYKLLSSVAHILQAHAEIVKLRIEGHVDSKIPPFEGLELSRARAAAVRHWLVDHGKVDGTRLAAQGFGADRPIADNRDFVGRAKNRRIEFVVMEKREETE